MQIKRLSLLAIGLILILPALAHAKNKDCNPYFYNVHMAYDDYMALPKAQRDMYNRYDKAYVNLDNQPMPDSLREAVEESRDWVRETVGYLPPIERYGFTSSYCMTRPMVLHMWERGVKQVKSNNMTKGNEIAQFTYLIPMDDPKKLISNLITVKDSYKGKGLSELLTLETLALYPFIERIEVDHFEDDNLDTFQAARKAGEKCKDSIKQTASYKKFARIGFTEIVDKDCFTERNPNTDETRQNASFTVSRPAK